MPNPFINALMAGSQNKSARLDREFLQKQRQREEELNRILGNAFIPARTEMQDIPEAERSNYMSPQIRREVQTPARYDLEGMLPQLAQGGFGKEALGLMQAEQAKGEWIKKLILEDKLKTAR